MYSYYFNEEHQLFRTSLRAFLAKEVTPNIDQWEENRRVPRELYQKFGEMGYFGLLFPEKYGGLELDFFYAVIFIEEMGKVNSAGFSAAMQAHPFLALSHINAVGNDAQKKKYLEPGINGECFGCLAITEPSGGSDVANIQTKAVKEDDFYVLNGSKTFITNGVHSDFLVVAAKTDTTAKTNGISLFIVDRDTPGLSAHEIDTLGWHASDTAEIAFDDVRIPAENLLGEENQGFFYIMQRFALERLVMALAAVSSSELALEKALQYMSEREAFGRKINRFQVLRHDVAQMASEIEVLKIFNYELCRRFNKEEYIVKEAAMAKLRCTELAADVADKCLQMFGGYGFTEEYPLARMYRDAQLGPIGGGTSEIMCEIIAKMMIDGKEYDTVLKGKNEGDTGLFDFTEEHGLFRQGLRAFFDKEAIPFIDQWEKDHRIPKELWKKMGDLGFLGLGFPTEYGGQDLDYTYDIIFNEELARVNSGGFAITQQVTQYMASPYILKYGDQQLKEKYLPGIISGEKICSIAITEPCAGSDAANIQTKAVRKGDHYVVNGSKTFITNGVYGDFIVTVVKTDPKAGVAGVSLLVIDRNAPGVSARKIKKLGWWSSDTAELSFDNVKVPVGNLIGQEGQGFYYLMNGLQLERLVGLPTAIKSMEYGIAQTLKYFSEREAFGRKLERFQVLRHRLARMAAEVEALKAFVYYCAKIYADGIYDVKLCSIAKLIVGETLNDIGRKCLQLHGGYGFTEALPFARFFRDSRVVNIGGGTTQVMRNIIAKMVVDDVNYEAAATTNTTSKKPSAKGNAEPKPAKKEKTLAEILKGIEKSAGKAPALGKTLKFDFGDQQLFIDGKGESNQVSTRNDAADCTVGISFQDFQALISGKLNPMNAMMSGRLKIDGDMGVALKLQALFG